MLAWSAILRPRPLRRLLLGRRDGGFLTAPRGPVRAAWTRRPASSCALTWHLGLLFAADAPCAESFFCSSDFLWDQLLKGEFLTLRVQANSAYF